MLKSLIYNNCDGVTAPDPWTPRPRRSAALPTFEYSVYSVVPPAFLCAFRSLRLCVSLDSGAKHRTFSHLLAPNPTFSHLFETFFSALHHAKLRLLKFDPATKVFEVSIRELAEDEGVSRIGFGRGEGWHRLGLGAELHARVLQERWLARPAYRREVHMQIRCPVGNWTALITGRLDGCMPDGKGGWLIEEFKSAWFPAQESRRSGRGL